MSDTNASGFTIPTERYNVINPAGAGRVWTGYTSFGATADFLSNRRRPPAHTTNLFGGIVPNPKL
jgi:hypothetical protein